MGATDALLLQARLLWDGAAAERGMDEAGNKAKGLETKIGAAFKRIGAAIAAALTVDAIKNFAVACVEAGAQVSAETAAYSQIMGDYASEASAKLQSVADATGMVNTRLTPYMTSMTAKFKGLGYGVDEATSLAARGLTLAADASAFWDKSLDESMGHLNSFINGSYEGGEAIGLFANDTQMAAYAVEQGIVKDTKAWADLDEATKQATRLEYAENMMKQSGATGQAAKESGAYANVMANLAEKWRQFKAQIGEPLIQHVVTPAVELLSKGIDKLSAAVEYVKEHFDEWRPYIEGAAIALGILVAAIAGFEIGSMISKMWQFATVIDATTGKTKLMAAAQAALNFVMNLNPIGLLVMMLAALAAGLVIAYNKSESFRNAVNNLWETVKSSEAWQRLSAAASTVWEGLKAGAKLAIDTLKSIFSVGLSVVRGDWSGAWEGIKNIFGNIMANIRNTVKTGVDFIGNLFGFPSLSSKVASVFDSVKQSITSKIESARDTVKGIVDKIVGFFTGAKFSWPKIPTPHFSITPAGWKIGDLLEGSIPKLGITWHAEAMDEAAVLDGATIFGAANGQLLGGGEAGREIVSGEAHLIGLINQAVAQNNSAMLDVLQRILSAIQRIDVGLYDTIVDAMTDGVRWKWDGREIGRLVKAHA